MSKNDNVYQINPNLKEGCIYIIWAENTSLYNIAFIEGDFDAQLGQIRLASPYQLKLSNTYAFNNHLVIDSITDLEKMIYGFLSPYRKNGNWFELNTAILERLNTIFKSVSVKSTIEEGRLAVEALRYLSEEALKHGTKKGS